MVVLRPISDIELCEIRAVKKSFATCARLIQEVEFVIAGQIEILQTRRHE